MDCNRHPQPPWGVSYPLLYPHPRQPLLQLPLHLLHLRYRPHFNPLQLLLHHHHHCQHQLISEPAQQAVKPHQHHCQACQRVVSQQLQQQAQACQLPLELLLGLVRRQLLQQLLEHLVSRTIVLRQMHIQDVSIRLCAVSLDCEYMTSV